MDQSNNFFISSFILFYPSSSSFHRCPVFISAVNHDCLQNVLCQTLVCLLVHQRLAAQLPTGRLCLFLWTHCISTCHLDNRVARKNVFINLHFLIGIMKLTITIVVLERSVGQVDINTHFNAVGGDPKVTQVLLITTLYSFHTKPFV
jgi:hypothetical protein